MSDAGGIVKLPKLHKAADFIQWKCRVYLFLCYGDYGLICFQKPSVNLHSREGKQRTEQNVKAKINIVLSLDENILAKTHQIANEDEKPSKELCEKLPEIFTT